METPKKMLSFWKTEMPKQAQMLKVSGLGQSDALALEKPKTEESGSWNSPSVICSTLPTHCSLKRSPWEQLAPNGLTHNQVNFVSLLPKGSTPLSTKPRTEHMLMLILAVITVWPWWYSSLRWRKTTSQCIRFNMEKLKDSKTSSLLEANVGSRFAVINLIVNDINTITDNIKKALHETAIEVLGKEWKKNKLWVMDDIWMYGTRKGSWRKPGKWTLKQQNSTMMWMCKPGKNETCRRELDNKQCDIKSGMREGNSKVTFDTLEKVKRS